MLNQLLYDEAGFVVSTELVLVATILVIGLIVGQTTLRDNVLTELGDTADAISAINQSYEWSNTTGHSSSTAGSEFNDAADFCDSNNNGAQGVTNNFTGTCISIDGNDPGEGVQSPVSPGTAN